MIPEIFAVGAFGVIALFSILTSLITLAVIVYGFYHLLVRQERMATEEKILWAVAMLLFPFFGALVYFLASWTGFTGFLGDRKLSELERLAELRDNDAITEEEYQKMKSEVIEDLRE